jgi:hypothetical protein
VFPIVLFVSSNTVSASCGSASCPLNHDRMFRAGLLTLSFSYEWIDQNQLHLGKTLSFVGAVPEEHDEVSTMNKRAVMTFGYGLSDAIALQVILPYVQREHTHIAREENGDVVESWDFGGFGDAVVMGQAGILMPDDGFEPSLTASAGVKLPTGETGLANADGERAEVTIQPGSGSVDVLLGLHYRQDMITVPMFDGQYSSLPVIASATYRLNGKGTDDYRAGNGFMIHLGTGYRFLTAASLLFQLNGTFEGQADIGSTHEQAENTGGTWIFASPGLEVSIFDAFTAFGYVQLPVYRDVNGLQQTAKYNLQFGLTYSAGLLDL